METCLHAESADCQNEKYGINWRSFKSYLIHSSLFPRTMKVTNTIGSQICLKIMEGIYALKITHNLLENVWNQVVI